jgi:FMN phosphatase YigB (HAD superfamily)
LARSRDYLMATLNNESLELNLFRIEKFGLQSRFSLFISSCFMGVAKPNPDLFRSALRITQREADECLFIDDREANLESARGLGMRTIRFENCTRLHEELRDHGVVWNSDIHSNKEK